MSNSNNAGSNLVFFLLGAAAGAAIALLYAPQEGEATRRLIGEKAGDVKDKAAEVTSNVTQTAKETYSSVLDKAQGVLNRGQQAAHEATDGVAEKIHTAIDNAAPA